MRKLRVTHNAGFFSCCSIALTETMIDFNQNKGLADIVDRTQQYDNYKANKAENLIPVYFDEQPGGIPYNGEVRLTTANTYFQFSDYRLLCFDEVKPFMDKFFTPSDYVMSIVRHYEEKYRIEYEHTCGVFYRGNDKNRETTIAPYSEFLNKTQDIMYNLGLGSEEAANLKFFVLPDETEFLEAFRDMYPTDTITPDELPHMRKKDSAMFFELPISERAEYAAKFLAAVIVMSRCKHLITHSGNCGLWATLYRGNANNVHQWLNDRWL